MNEDRMTPFKELAHDLGTRFSRHLPEFRAVSTSAASCRFTTSGLRAKVNDTVWLSRQFKYLAGSSAVCPQKTDGPSFY